MAWNKHRNRLKYRGVWRSKLYLAGKLINMERRKLIKYLTIGALFFIVSLFLYIRADRIEISYKFKGTIDKVTYSDKKFPNVVIKGETYFISYPNEDFNDKIEVGDSLVKEKNSRIYQLIKFKTGEVIFSK